MTALATATIEGDTLALAGVLDFDSVLDVAEQGQHWLQESAPAQCNLDLSAISYSSSAGIALLLGWLRVAKKQQKTLHILRIPDDMVALARVGGLEDLLSGA
ncbi:MAG: anti-sigma-factor antagonist [Verrucomicrobiaceae bacterium]|nr:anti-sigma-factor antagonist [Verrucomicrobiaceae bacterium]